MTWIIPVVQLIFLIIQIRCYNKSRECYDEAQGYFDRAIKVYDEALVLVGHIRRYAEEHGIDVKWEDVFAHE